jgi:hypothetical protein
MDRWLWQALRSCVGMMLPDRPRRCRGRSLEDLCALERICRVITGPVEVPRSWRYEVTTRKLQLFRSDCHRNYLSAPPPLCCTFPSPTISCKFN